MVDHLHGDLAGVGPVKRATSGRVQLRPGRLVHLGPERPLQLLIRLVPAREIGVAHEETLAVVVRVDEPAGDVGGRVAANLPGGGVVDVEVFSRAFLIIPCRRIQPRTKALPARVRTGEAWADPR